ncbi:conserved hypothetical protein [Burkholderia mallei PRL-20]|nr:conserved hypothetical protein [Burkholderia mallei PRL-20]
MIPRIAPATASGARCDPPAGSARPAHSISARHHAEPIGRRTGRARRRAAPPSRSRRTPLAHPGERDSSRASFRSRIERPARADIIRHAPRRSPRR